MDMDIPQDGSVIGRTFLHTIPPTCSSLSDVQHHSVVVRTVDGTMV